jgi:NCS1 family nucleobase:cation symporter-1
MRKSRNISALLALILGIAPSLAGFLTAIGAVSNAPAFLVEIYNYAWFVGAFTSGFLYFLFMRRKS